MKSENKPEDLDTIWRVPDALWERMSKVLSVYDPPHKVGRPRMNQRLTMDPLIYRLRKGVNGTTCSLNSAGA